MTTEFSEGTAAAQPAWVKGAGVASLVLGIGLGLLTLSSVAGIWFGLWDFRRGFALLGTANKYGEIVAWICVALAVVLVVVNRTSARKGSGRFAALAILGAAVAWAAYLVPESYRPPEGVSYPPIHDISTDRVRPPAFVAVLPLRADAPNPVVYGTSEGMSPKQLAALTEEAYPDLVTRRFATPAEEIFDRALAAVRELGWEVVAADAAAGRIEATDTTFWFRFKDDVVIRIEEQDGDSVVDARSTSRVGRGDVGANAIRLRKFFALLEG